MNTQPNPDAPDGAPLDAAELELKMLDWSQKMTSAARGISLSSSDHIAREHESDFRRAAWNYRDCANLLIEAQAREIAEFQEFKDEAMPLLEWAQENAVKMGGLGGENLFKLTRAYVERLERALALVCDDYDTSRNIGRDTYAEARKLLGIE